MFTLYDKFNHHPISRHRTLQAAANAEVRHGRAVRRNNGPNSYIPTAILDDEGDDVRMSDEYARANHIATYGQ